MIIEGEHADTGGDAKDFPEVERAVGVEEGFVKVFLADEADEEWNASHGECADEGGSGGEWHGAAQAAEDFDVPGAGFVINGAGGHEEGGFVERVSKEVDEAGLDREFRAEAEEHDEGAEDGEGRVGEDLFEIALAEAEEHAEDHGDSADGRDDDEPEGVVVKNGV